MSETDQRQVRTGSAAWDTLSRRSRASTGGESESFRESLRLSGMVGREVATEQGWSFAAETLVDYCARLSERVETAAANRVKAAYFPTGAGRSELLLLAVLNLAFFARLLGYVGPVAWIAFPTELIDEAYRERIARAFAVAENIRRAEYPAGMAGVNNEPPLQVAFSGSLAKPGAALGECRQRHPEVLPDATAVFGAACGLDLGAVRTACPEFVITRGLPVICIPARGCETLRIADTPWFGSLYDRPESRP